jgi:acyl-CoA synthetase (AMP-forming)/AMP-acid ligase II
MTPRESCLEPGVVLRKLAETMPERIAVHAPDADGSVTFAQLYARAYRQAADLRHGSAHSTRTIVVIPAESSTRFFTAVAAAWIAGLTPLPVPPRAAAVIRAETRTLDPAGLHCHPWKAVVRVHEGRSDVVVTHGESPACPRKAHALGMTHAGSAMIASPLYLNGPFELAVRQLLLGGTILLQAPFCHATWLSMAAAHRPTWAFLVPTQVRRLINSAGLPSVIEATRSLDRLLISSQPVPADLARALGEAFDPGRVAVYYGTTEYDGTLTVLGPEPVTAGAPIRGAALRIVDQDGAVVGTGKPGIIQGRSRTGSITHRLREPCLPPSRWHSVGDRGRLTDEGTLELLSVDVPGRAIVGGVNVALNHVRAVIAAHDQVNSCSVEVEADPHYGQIVTVRVRPRRPVALTVADLEQFCTARLDAAERPRAIHIDPPLHEDVIAP